MINSLQLVAQAAISGDALRTRSLLQDWLATRPIFSQLEMPIAADQTELALTAALAELFAQRANQPPPHWTAGVGPAKSPTYLVRAAATMPRLREQCELESPAPLKTRRFFAPANYLELR